MPVTVTNDQIGDIYQKYAYTWTVTISLNGTPPDISGDTVKLIIKEVLGTDDDDAELVLEADVTTHGALGKAIFALDGDDTDIPAGLYYMEIKWSREGSPTRIYGKTISINEAAFETTT